MIWKEWSGLSLDPTIVLPYLNVLIGYGLYVSYLVVRYYDFDRRMTVNAAIIVLWLVVTGPAVVAWLTFPYNSHIAYTISPAVDLVMFGGSLLTFIILVADAVDYWNRDRMGLA